MPLYCCMQRATYLVEYIWHSTQRFSGFFVVFPRFSWFSRIIVPALVDCSSSPAPWLGRSLGRSPYRSSIGSLLATLGRLRRSPAAARLLARQLARSIAPSLGRPWAAFVDCPPSPARSLARTAYRAVARAPPLFLVHTSGLVYRDS